MLATTMPRLLWMLVWMSPHRHRPPHLPLCVLTSFFRIHVSNLTFSPQEIDIFDGPARDTAAGPAQDFVDEWLTQDAVNEPSNEILRQLACFYLREPNSQVSLIRLEPGDAHRVRVAITLELANL
jgi:hypothetical protein